MNRDVAVRAALLQAALAAAAMVVLAVAFEKEFFEDWGWLVGPGSWLLCAAATARALHLPVGTALTGAALAGLVLVVGVLVGRHSLGGPPAVVLFGLWCGRAAQRGRRDLTAEAV